MPDIDVVVIGAGAAGIAAAHRLRTSPLSGLVLEARERVGGRAHTVTRDGLSLDLGCGWLHSADENEWTTFATRLGLTIDRTQAPWSRQAYKANFPSQEQQEFGAAWQQFYAQVRQGGRAPVDRSAASFLDPACRFNELLNAISCYANGVELDRLSVLDFCQYHDTGINWRVVQGYGTLIRTVGERMRVRLSCPVSLLDHSGKVLRLTTPQGTLLARAAIITVPPSIIRNEVLRFEPVLPDKMEAAHCLPLGRAEKVFLHVREPEFLPAEVRAFGAIDRTATGSYHLRPFGRPVIEGYFGGRYAEELGKAGRRALESAAIEELSALWGPAIRDQLHPLATSAWGEDCFAGGSYSYAKIGHRDARARLAEPVDERLFFAGEACSPAAFSTAHGALRSGLAACELAIAASRRPRPIQRA